MKKVKGAYCPTCGERRMFEAKRPSGCLHLTLTVLTLGAWLLLWPLLYGRAGTRYHCTVCGAHLTMQMHKKPQRARPEKASSDKSDRCPHCGEPVQTTATFCKRCGKSVRCPQCSGPIGPGATFCRSCGTALAL